mgnify:CR=1 FL=1
MQRWKMTAGLTGLALVAIAVAPRLTAALQAATPAPPPAAPERATPAPPPAEPSVPSGHLDVRVRLDQSAAVAHRTSERFVTIDVRAPGVDGRNARRPVDLAVVLDTSGSMNEGKLDQAKRATRRLAESMGPDDTFSLVTFADRARVVVGSGPADVAGLDRVLDRVWDYGGTNLYQGMTVAAEQVARRPEAVQRLVVLSDGQPTTGRKDDASFERLATELASQGVGVSTVGLGLDFNEDLLASLADLGGGTYDFVGDAVDLTPVFAEELQHTSTVLARDTRVQLELPDGLDGLEIIGWSATRSSGGWSVYLGDVAAGSHTRIVAKVEVRDDADLGPLDVRASATYLDLIDGQRARTDDQATLAVTADARVVAASVDPEASAVARRAYGNWYLLKSTRAYAEGKADAAPLLRAGRQVIEEAARFDPEVSRDLERFDATRQLIDEVSPSHPSARQRIKANKERYRAVFR